MELGLCISRIIHRDDMLTNIIIRTSCLTVCSNYEPDESDDVDSIEAEENSINKNIYFLNGEFSGSRDWFASLGVMISKLPNLTQLTFDELDIHVTPHMRTNSLCVMGLPICEFFFFPPRTRTGTPRMHTGTMFCPDWRVWLSHAPFW